MWQTISHIHYRPSIKKKREREEKELQEHKRPIYTFNLSLRSIASSTSPLLFSRLIKRNRFRWHGEGSYGLSTCGGFETKIRRWRMHWIVPIEFGRGEGGNGRREGNMFSFFYKVSKLEKERTNVWLGFTLPKCTILRGFAYGEINR